MQVKNKVQLVTYPDGLGGNLQTLGRTLEEHFPGLFEGGIHILPPFPSSGDRGFAPLTYDEIDGRFGSWSDIRGLSERYDIMLDMIVNHISSRSALLPRLPGQGPRFRVGGPVHNPRQDLAGRPARPGRRGQGVPAAAASLVDVPGRDRRRLRSRFGRPSARRINPARSTWIGDRPASGPSSKGSSIGSARTA